jgi:hypothetical protein
MIARFILCRLFGHHPIPNPLLWARRAYGHAGGELTCSRCGACFDDPAIKAANA